MWDNWRNWISFEGGNELMTHCFLGQWTFSKNSGASQTDIATVTKKELCRRLDISRSNEIIMKIKRWAVHSFCLALWNSFKASYISLAWEESITWPYYCFSLRLWIQQCRIRNTLAHIQLQHAHNQSNCTKIVIDCFIYSISWFLPLWKVGSKEVSHPGYD